MRANNSIHSCCRAQHTNIWSRVHANRQVETSLYKLSVIFQTLPQLYPRVVDVANITICASIDYFVVIVSIARNLPWSQSQGSASHKNGQKGTTRNTSTSRSPLSDFAQGAPSMSSGKRKLVDTIDLTGDDDDDESSVSRKASKTGTRTVAGGQYPTPPLSSNPS